MARANARVVRVDNRAQSCVGSILLSQLFEFKKHTATPWHNLIFGHLPFPVF
jgi:hypothetical protein